jgi:outer membrane immunogenic protein
MRSKIVSLLAVTFSLGFAQAASAADMPVKAPMHVAAPATFSWTGCYVGANAGYGWGRNRNNFNDAIRSDPTEGGEPLPAEFASFDHNTSGGVAGGQIGCNYQFQQNWVVGVEGEFAWSGIKGSLTNPEDVADPGQYSRFETKNLWNGDLALRLGYAVIAVCCTARSVRLGVASATRKRMTTFPPLMHAQLLLGSAV